MNQNIIDKIVAWAQQEESIRVLLLTGSLASRGPKDEFSDYDIAVFTNEIQNYTTEDVWMNHVAKVIVYEPCEHEKDGTIYPTRLVIYEGGLQVDFAFFDLAYFQSLTQKEQLPVEYNLGYKVLLDKDGLTKNLQPPTYEYPYTQPPSQEEFDLAVRVFFFESFKEAKALVRNDLWHAKIRDWSIKKRLLRMIEWHAKSVNGWNYDTNGDAKKMQLWVDPAIWQKAHDVFAGFDADSSWKALKVSLQLFSRLAQETANKLNYRYLLDVDESIRILVKRFSNQG